jgi:hypothetical protein
LSEVELFASEPEHKPHFDIRKVFEAFQCAAECVKHHPIRDWSTFAQLMYCVIDDCICRKIMRQERSAAAVKRSKSPKKG